MITYNLFSDSRLRKVIGFVRMHECSEISDISFNQPIKLKDIENFTIQARYLPHTSVAVINCFYLAKLVKDRNLELIKNHKWD